MIKPLLTDSQLKVLADIGIAAGQLFLAAMVLPFVIPGLDKSKIMVIELGSVFTIVSWSFSVLITRRIKNDSR
jgi:hypothetical protein